MRRSVKILGLDDYRLTVAQLGRLGNRPVHLSIQQRGPVMSQLVRLKPKQREKRMSETLQKGLARLRGRWPAAGLSAGGNGRLPWTVDAVVPARQVEGMSKTPDVKYIFLNR